jgi:hypothetical protein
VCLHAPSARVDRGGACKHAACAGSIGIAAVPVQAKDQAAKGVVSGAGGVAGGPGGWEGVVVAGGGGGGSVRASSLLLTVSCGSRRKTARVE